MMDRIALLGGGGHASDVLGLVEALARPGSAVDVFVGDDDWERSDRFEGRTATLCSIDQALDAAGVFVGAAGYPKTRAALVQRALLTGASPCDPLVHPSAERSTGVAIDEGAVVQGLAWLSPLVRVGSHAYVGYGAKVGHDATVGSFASLMPGCFVGGDSSIGEGVLIGAGAIVLQGLSIGDGAVVGAGAVVVDHVASGETVVGSPARKVIR